MTAQFDVIIIGGGMVGAAIGYGLAGGKRRILMLDGADTDYRAAKANFGLVWAHGKGMRDPNYQRLSLNAAKAWPSFASQLEEESGISLDYEQKGGLNFCLSDDEFDARAKAMDAWNRQTPELAPSAHMLDRAELLRRFPTMKIGKAVVGASFGEFDGHANPLRLLAAMQKAFMARGGQLQNNRPVTDIRRLSGGGFEVQSGEYRAQCERIVIAAGLGCAALGPMVGLNVPIRPQRGQLLVTERLAPLLPIPGSGLRQTAEGTVMIGVTQEEVGFDLATTTEGAARITRKALKILPDLAQAKLVRQWSCLRIMTPDGNPVYARSLTHPGAEIATCHSGVTLASFHANEYAKAFDAKSIPADLEIFHYGRFDLQKLPELHAITITIYVDGVPVMAEQGETVAAVLLRQSTAVNRTSPVKGSPRAPYCMMGVCFDCLAVVDGNASTQTCLVTVKDGMRVERQYGRRSVVS